MTSLPVIVAAGNTAAALRVPALFAAATLFFLVWAVRARTQSARFAYLSLLFGTLGFCWPGHALGWATPLRVLLTARLILAGVGLLFCVLALARRRQDQGGLLLPVVGGLAATLHAVGVVLTVYLLNHFGPPGAGGPPPGAVP